MEGGTEVYQFVTFGHPSWIGFYYVGLATTGIGFFLMYRGRHEWTDAHRRQVARSHHFLWTALGIFLGVVAAIAVLGTVVGPSGRIGPPSALGWVVGGLVALSFWNFFFSLVVLVRRLVGRAGRFLSWAALAWALGVSVYAGYVVGNGFVGLLHQFFTDPLGLVISFAPLAFVIAPLFVAYFLFAAAYLDAVRRLPPRVRESPSAGTLRSVPAAEVDPRSTTLRTLETER